MEANEIAALNYCSQDIRSKVFVSASVLQKLLYRGILSKEERQSIKNIRDECKRNSKLVEILKKKPGGFQAFTDALLSEKKTNEYFVNRMRNQLNKLNSKQRVVPENTKQPSHIRELEQRVKELEHSIDKMASLVLGSSNATSGDEEAKNMNILNQMIDELEKARKYLKMRGYPLLETCKMNLEKTKADLAQQSKTNNNLRKHIAELEEEITTLKRHIEEIKKYQDDIIHDKVDIMVKERLVRINMNEFTVETHPTLNPDQMESENDPLEVGSQLSIRTDLTTATESTTTQPLPNGLHIQKLILNIENNATLQINNDGQNFASQQ